MKLSKNTMNYLKHFSTISPNFVFQKGTQQNTISFGKDRAVSTTLDTSFPLDFPIKDLGGFVKAASSLNDPDVFFSKSKLTLSDKNGKILFKRSKKRELIVLTKKINFQDPEVEFEISNKKYMSLVNSLKRHGFYYITFKGDGKFITAESELSYKGEYIYIQRLGSTQKQFSFRFRATNLICPVDDYLVSISSKGIGRFQSKNSDYISYIAIDKPKST